MVDTEAVVTELSACAEHGDFEAALKLVTENKATIAAKLSPLGIRDALKKTTKDRLLLSFLDGVGFGVKQLDQSLMRLEKLVSFQVNSLVLSKAWGLGKVKRLDYFYKRITVDFKTKRGHQFTYDAATDMLVSAPEKHILVTREADPAAFDKLLKEKPGDFVKAIIESYGDMTLVKLEDTMLANGFLKGSGYKTFKDFWDKARAELKTNKFVVIPAKRSDLLQVKQSVEDYGDKWLSAFSSETDPKLILAAVREFVAQDKFYAKKDATAEELAKLEDVRKVIGARLGFAVTAARKVDDALYARLAYLVSSLGFATPPAATMRAYLWERKRYIKAAALLPAREVGQMISFLADSDESKAKLYASIPEFCFSAVTEIINLFGTDSACRKAMGDFMRQPKAPATLTTLLVGKYEQFMDWPIYSDTCKEGMPPLITLLTHAIALGEGRQGGETLRMQNIVRRLFSDKTWLEKVFGWLTNDGDKALFFERFQASIAWDPSTHHAIVIRMTHIVPALTAHLVQIEKKKEYAHITSPRSYAQKKREYLKLINEDMPANVKRIEFAKSYGDLSENAEYQYAKDEQRALMQKQTLMQQELENVKEGDFADASVDEVMPGVTVVIQSGAEEKTYHILGEWDNDLDKGVISSKTRLAANMFGKKAGDNFELPGVEGAAQFAKIVQIKPLPEEIRAWMKEV